MLDALRKLGRLLLTIPRRRAWIAPLLWYALICVLSHRPGDPRPGPPSLSYFFNLGHAPLYGLLCLGLLMCAPRRAGWVRLSPAVTAATVLLILALALLDEGHQSFVSGRHFSLLDVITDLCGALGVLGVVAYLGRETARESGLTWRLAVALVASLTAAGAATIMGA